MRVEVDTGLVFKAIFSFLYLFTRSELVGGDWILWVDFLHG